MPGHQVQTIWPENQHYLPPIIAGAYLTFIPLLAVFLAKRTPRTLRQWWELSIVRKLVFFVLADSSLFLWASALLLLGVGTSFTEASCSLAIFWCIFLYSGSKVVIYRECLPTLLTKGQG